MTNLNYKFNFLKKFSKHIKDNNLSTYYLGDLKNINDTSNSDIDLYINFKKNNDILRLIKKFSVKYRYKIFNIIQHEINSFYIIFSKKVNGEYKFIAIDICNNYYHNHRSVINFQKIKYESKNNYLNTYVKLLPNYILFKYYFIKKILKSNFDIKSLIFLKNVIKKDKKLIKNYLINIIQIKNTRKLLNAILNLNVSFFKKNIFFLKKKFLNNEEIKINFKDIFKIINYYYVKIKNNPGLEISFLGVDGSGKSTIIKFLYDDFCLNNHGFNYSFRNIKLIHLSLFKLKNAKKKNLKPHNKKEYNFFLSFIKLIYFIIREIFEKFFLKYLKKKSYMILFDRFFIDIFIDPLRYRIKSNYILKIFKVFFGKIFLKNINFIIIADYNDIINRKKKLKKKTIIELISMYKEMKNFDKSMYLVNNKLNKINYPINLIKTKIIDHQNNKMMNLIK